VYALPFLARSVATTVRRQHTNTIAPYQVTVCKSIAGSCNYTTIWEAIAAANANDTILVTAGDYTDECTSEITKPLTIVYVIVDLLTPSKQATEH
jgi:hypothetical protein